MGSFDVSKCMCMRGGTHTCFVGEETALCTLADRGLECVADAAADDCLRNERVLEDHAERCGEILDAADDEDQTAEEVETCHEGHDLFGEGSDTVNAADEDERGDCRYEDTDDPGRNAERGVAGFCHGVGLNHCTHEAERENGCYSEEGGEELTELVRERVHDVVNGTAGHSAVSGYLAGLLSENSFGVDGSHTEESDDPHPEDSTGAANEDRTAGTDDITGTDLCGDCGGESLERAHTTLGGAAAERDITEHFAHAFAEAADLHEAGFYRVDETDTDQKDNQNIV